MPFISLVDLEAPTILATPPLNCIRRRLSLDSPIAETVSRAGFLLIRPRPSLGTSSQKTRRNLCEKVHRLQQNGLALLVYERTPVLFCFEQDIPKQLSQQFHTLCFKNHLDRSSQRTITQLFIPTRVTPSLLLLVVQ